MTKNTLITLEPGSHGFLPISALVPSPHNMRKDAHTEAEIAQSAAMIESASGVLQNLIVHPIKKGRKATGTFGVAGGEKRRSSLALLLSEKPDIWFHYLGPVCCITEQQALMMSVQENTRTPVHPADQIEAFRTLVSAGESVADVAAAFGVDVRIVQARLKLANVAPMFIDMLRTKEIDLGVLEALTSVADQAAQVTLWQSLNPWERNASAIRRIARSGGVHANDRLARFVGVEAYREAGGQVDEDLFDGAVTFKDPILLRELAEKKLAEMAAQFDGTEGVNWVCCNVDADRYSFQSAYSEAPVVRREPSETEAVTESTLETKLAELEAKMVELEDQEYDEATDEAYSALSNEHDAISEQLEAAQRARDCAHPDATAMTGAVFFIDHDGQARVFRNLVKAEDASALNISSGAPSSAPKIKPVHSARLCSELSTVRRHVLAHQLSQQPHVALALVTSLLADRLFGDSMPVGCFLSGSFHISISDVIRPTGADGADEAPAQRLYREAFEVAKAEYASTEIPFFEWLLTQDQATVLRILAVCVGASSDGVTERDGSPNDGLLSVARALQLDMADWWTADTDYFGSVSKDRTIAVLTEAQAVSGDETAALAALKKRDLVPEAAKRMQGKRWLPEMMQMA